MPLSARACGLEPITIFHYLPDNVILTRNSCLAKRACCIWIDPPSSHISLPVWSASSASHNGLLQGTPEADPLKMDVQLFKQLPASPLES